MPPDGKLYVLYQHSDFRGDFPSPRFAVHFFFCLRVVLCVFVGQKGDKKHIRILFADDFICHFNKRSDGALRSYSAFFSSERKQCLP